jgi:hypothetical protein
LLRLTYSSEFLFYEICPTSGIPNRRQSFKKLELVQADSVLTPNELGPLERADLKTLDK